MKASAEWVSEQLVSDSDSERLLLSLALLPCRCRGGNEARSGARICGSQMTALCSIWSALAAGPRRPPGPRRRACHRLNWERRSDGNTELQRSGGFKVPLLFSVRCASEWRAFKWVRHDLNNGK